MYIYLYNLYLYINKKQLIVLLMRVLIVTENRDTVHTLASSSLSLHIMHMKHFFYKMLNNCMFYYFCSKKILKSLFLM